MRRVLLLLLLVASSARAQWPTLDAVLAKQGGGEKDAALLISIEDYLMLPDIAGATQNASDWYMHLTKTRGVPAANVVWLKDNEATLEGIKVAAEKAAHQVKPGGVLWVVFVGHGAPSETGDDGVLVGADAQQSTLQLYARSLPRSSLLKLLEGGTQGRTFVFLDACFSGQSSAGQQLATGAMPTLPEKERTLSSKSIVLLTAGTSRQFAGPLPGEARPAFSYLALGGLRGWADEDGDGVVTAGELASFSNAVMRSTVNGRTQTPTLNPESASGVVMGKVAAGRQPFVLSDIVVWLKAGSREALEPPPELKSSRPRVSSGKVKPVVGSLTVKTSPSGSRLDLVDPKGQPLATRAPLMKSDALPGRWKVTAALDGYVTQSRDVDVPADDVAFVELTLQKLGSLEVVGTPEGALVRVTGPDGFKDEGGLPWKAEGLTPGEYVVDISREGYAAESWKGTVSAGQAQRAQTKLKRVAKQAECTGRQVPGGYRQKTVLLPKGGGDTLEVARLEAREQLRDELCEGLRRFECEGLEQFFIDWVKTEQADKVCATAVIQDTVFKDWKDEYAQAKLAEQFRAVVRKLFPEAIGGANEKPKKPQGIGTVVLGRVKDTGTGDGQRAHWMQLGMLVALQEAGITHVWSSEPVPKNATVLVGEVLSREEKGRKIVDVIWTAIFSDGRSRTFMDISMFASLVPPGPVHFWATDEKAVVSVVFDDQDENHGAMCEGQRKQLYVASSEDRCVLIFDVDGEGGSETSLLVFPNEAMPNCEVRKGERLMTSYDNAFSLSMSRSESRRLVAIAAPSRAELPVAFKSLIGTCMLTPPQVALARNEDSRLDRFEQTFRAFPAKDSFCQGRDKATKVQRQQERPPLCSGQTRP